MNISQELTRITTPWSFDADGGPTLRGRVLENPQNPLIHFIHGNGFCGAVYWNFLREFRQDYGLFLHDVQGHADSDNGDGFPGWSPVVERTATVIRQHPATAKRLPLIGMGHSFGASLTVFAAARHPELFSSLVLVDPVLFPPTLKMALRMIPTLNPVVRKARTRTTQWPTREETWNYLHQRGIFRGFPDEALECYIDHALEQKADGLHLKCPREFETQIFSSMPRGLWRAVSAIKCPVYILHGQQSYPFVAKGAARAARVNSNVTVETMPGGHCFMVQHPQQAHAHVQYFLQQLSRGTLPDRKIRTHRS